MDDAHAETFTLNADGTVATPIDVKAAPATLTWTQDETDAAANKTAQTVKLYNAGTAAMTVTGVTIKAGTGTNYDIAYTATDNDSMTAGGDADNGAISLTLTPKSVATATTGDGDTITLVVAYGTGDTAEVTVTAKILAPFTVEFDDMTQDYDGTPKAATIKSVTSAGEAVDVDDCTVRYEGTGTTTYGPSETPPTNAGTYTVTVSKGADSDSDTLTISKVNPTMTIADKTQTVGKIAEITAADVTLNPGDDSVENSDFTITYSFDEKTITVNNTLCDCNAADKLAHKADCPVAVDGTGCTCGANDGVEHDKKHAADCTIKDADGHCNCAIRNDLTEAQHAEGCKALVEGTNAVTDATWAAAEAKLNKLAVGDKFTVKVVFAGSDSLTTKTVTKEFTVAAESSAPTGGFVSSDFTVTYAAGSHGTINGATSEKVKRNESPVNVPTVTANKGYAFIGWSLDGKTLVNPAAQTITKNTTFTALYGDHLAYMVGRSATEFVPNGNLTRAEAAAILSRLTEGFEEDGTYPAAPYSDLTAGAWYVKYVNFAADKGIVNGRDNGTFDPDANITRAEFATMIANFAKIAKVDTAAVSTDVAGHWAEGYIAALEQAKVVTGYEDGTFKPNANITRAEAATMVNGAIGRVPMSELDLAANGYVNPFVDVTTSQWFYAQVMEATASHLSGHFHK